MAVVDPVPLFRYGLVTVLQRGSVVVDEMDGLPERGTDGSHAAVMVGVHTDDDLRCLAGFCESAPRTPVVAVLGDSAPRTCRHALLAGATGVMPRSAGPARVLLVLRAALAGDCLLPAWVAAALADPRAAGRGPDLSDRQIVWLRALSAGRTVEKLADEQGYSSRQLFRLLRELYDVMGVANRHEAVSRATAWGFIQPAALPG